MEEYLKRQGKVNFNDMDINSEVKIEDRTYTSEDPVPIQDNIIPPQQEHKEGYIHVPDKLPLSAIIAWVVQVVVVVAMGTNMYTSMKGVQDGLTEKLNRIESNMYTNSEARLRLELEDAKIDQLRRELDAKGK